MIIFICSFLPLNILNCIKPFSLHPCPVTLEAVVLNWGITVNATGTSKQIMVFMMVVIWRIKSSEWICLLVNTSINSYFVNEILPLLSFYIVTISSYIFSLSELLFIWDMGREAKSFLSNNLFYFGFFSCLYSSPKYHRYSLVWITKLALEFIWFKYFHFSNEVTYITRPGSSRTRARNCTQHPKNNSWRSLSICEVAG